MKTNKLKIKKFKEEIMQKECTICGVVFEAKRKDRQYCDDCQKNSGKAKAKLNNAIMRSKYRLGEFDKVKDKVCSYCNRNFKTIDSHRDFCNSDCERNYKVKNNLCQYCKKLLYPQIITTAPTLHPECKEAAYRDWAIRKGWQRDCKQCGNEFLAKTKNQVYCSQECKKIFYAEDRVRPTQYQCIICNKNFIVPRNTEWDLYPEKALCSSLCKENMEYRNAKQKQIIAEARRKEREAEKLLKEQKAEEEFRKGVEENGLCIYCRTPNYKCEYIKSGFKIKPEGAKYKDSRIVECPGFTKEKKAKK